MPSSSPAWQQLATLAKTELQSGPLLKTRFATEPQRFKNFSIQQQGLLLDYSKQRIDAKVMRSLRAFWLEAELPGWLTRMRAGAALNISENRAVRHVDLRHPQPPAEVAAVLARMQQFCQKLHDGRWRGASGLTINNVVHLGIGGSDLGPRLVVRALAAQRRAQPQVDFVGNLDGADLAPLLKRLDPARTLFIVASKTFTTQETLTNARTARDWLVAELGESAVQQHFIAISAKPAEARKFGILDDQVYEFWDWVGGRFSLWSAIGLPIALAIGYEAYSQLLAGAHAMDTHFFQAPLEENLPATLALLSLWNCTFLHAQSQAILPYSQSLDLLPNFLQQLEMESNGKRVDRHGQPLPFETAPIIWGQAGTNGQHAFHQLIHQSGRLIPCDFLAFREPDFALPGHHAGLLANCLAQSEALMQGRSQEDIAAELRAQGLSEQAISQQAPHRTCPGNQPSTTLLLPRLTAYTLGQLIALYEHKVIALGFLWGLNSFDQWGVELGKQLAQRLQPLLTASTSPHGDALDSSTAGLLNWLKHTETAEQGR